MPGVAEVFAGIGRGRGQAQGLPLPFVVWGEMRAGTRPAPTFRCWGGRGQAQGLPLQFFEWAAL